MSGKGGENLGLQAVFPTVSQTGYQPKRRLKRDGIQTQYLEGHLIQAQENPQHGAPQNCPLTPAPHLTAARFLFFSQKSAYVQGTRKPNSCSLLWCPSLPSQPGVWCSSLPRMMPLGSSGGCQTMRTDVSLTSGNTSLTGGPGAAGEHRDHGSKGCTPRGSQAFCSLCTELQLKPYLSSNGWKHHHRCNGGHTTKQDTKLPLQGVIQLNLLRTCWNSILSSLCVSSTSFELLPDFTFASQTLRCEQEDPRQVRGTLTQAVLTSPGSRGEEMLIHTLPSMNFPLQH